MQPKLNPVFAQFKFDNEIQGSKTIDQYVTSLKLLAKDCLFKDEDDMIRDRIVFGVSSQRIREKLINEGEKLTLERAINISQSHEYAQEQLQTMSASARSEVHATIQRQAKVKELQPKKKWTTSSRRSVNATCGHCGYKSHSSQDKCPAKGKTCNKCHKLNHFEKVCRSKTVSVINNEHKNEDLYIDSVKRDIIVNGQAYAAIEVGPHLVSIDFKLDTGSQVNIIPSHIFKKLGIKHPLQPTSNT